MLRKAVKKDISRIAEILIFAKRISYRPIFEDDRVSFNVMQVLTEAESLQKPHSLDDVFVYDDGIVRAMMKRQFTGNTIKLCELFVDPFFQHNGIGSKILVSLVDEARKNQYSDIYLWVLEKNARARNFYEKHGFVFSGIREEFANTGRYKMKYIMPLEQVDCSSAGPPKNIR